MVKLEPQNEGFCLLLGRAKSCPEEWSNWQSPPREGGWGQRSERPEEGSGPFACQRTPPKFQREKRRMLSSFVLYGGHVFLILILFLRTWGGLIRWSLFPVTYHPTFRHLSGLCDATFQGNSVLIHLLMPLPSCSLRRESFQNKFWVPASLP